MYAINASRSVRHVVAGLVVAVAGTFAVSAMARPGGGAGFGLFEGPHIGRLLDGVNASDAQRTQIRQIMQAAREDMKAQREAGRSLQEQGVQLFTQPTVDANAVEALRQQVLKQQDQTSRRVSLAMIEISRVLTPEQRVQLGAQLKQRQETRQKHIKPHG